MTRTPHDQFAQLCLAGFLEPFGTPEIGRKVTSEVREVDVSFVPDKNRSDLRSSLGLLGRMVETQCLLEPFRNPVQPSHVRGCIGKLFDVQAELLRQAKQKKFRLREADLTRLWIFTPSVSRSVTEGFGAVEQEDWGSGIYFLPKHLHSALVAINQLPATGETLWIRLLGRESVQSQAVAELLELPVTHPFRQHALKQLATLRLTLQARQNLNRDQRGLIMSLSPLYERWQEETLQQGRQERSRELIESFLQTRFGSVDAELATLVSPLAQLPDAEFTALMMQLANLSRDDLLERFQNQN